ncbi:unnamed protein product [Mytilus coruscus]|uniref:WSC domain-containing protein n=1 Tax=Mytilus coruscus TaxID=42192 RepID=A0A6J8EQF4_MYTCO|nr:unnamed protein product [Mytilus coruscus]
MSIMHDITREPVANYCYCGNISPSGRGNRSKSECLKRCPGNNPEICGGDDRVTISEIANGEWSVWNDWKFCEVNCVREDTTNGTQRRWRTCSGSECCGDEMEERSCSEPGICKDRRTETVTVTNTEAASATSVYTRDSATADFMNMITSDTSSAIATNSTPYTTQELSSTTSENANNDISPVLTETSTQATTGLSTETVTVTNTEATITTSVSIRESTTADFMKMITSATTPAIVTQSTHFSLPELLSTISENADTAISTLMTETSTQATTANGEWNMWNDWKFCEVNCVREDTTEGKQRRWRTCKGSKCSGNYMEERSCLEQDICKGMRPRKLLCKCPKRLINTKWHFIDGKNITDAEVKKMVLEDFNKNIKSEISVDKKTVSKEVRKKNSSVNKRKSAQFIGWGCIVFLVLPMVFLIAIYILNCCIHFRACCGRRKRNRIAAVSVIGDHGDNVDITEEFYASRCGNNFHPDEIKLETYQRRRKDKQSSTEWMQ